MLRYGSYQSREKNVFNFYGKSSLIVSDKPLQDLHQRKKKEELRHDTFLIPVGKLKPNITSYCTNYCELLMNDGNLTTAV